MNELLTSRRQIWGSDLTRSGGKARILKCDCGECLPLPGPRFLLWVGSRLNSSSKVVDELEVVCKVTPVSKTLEKTRTSRGRLWGLVPTLLHTCSENWSEGLNPVACAQEVLFKWLSVHRGAALPPPPAQF